MDVVIGFDAYNQNLTGDVSMTLTAIKTDPHHVPCVLIAMAICIDQQGGKGGANYQIDVSCPILSDSHGTPHAVAIIYEDKDETKDINREKIL